MFFSSGSFGESPFSSRNESNSSTRGGNNISKSESTSSSFNYFNSNDGAENRWSNNSLVTPSRRVSVTNNASANSNGRNENLNRIQRMCLPVNISMIIKSLESSPSVFRIFGKRASSVTLVGWITHREVLASRMIFRVSDGTGGIDARFDIDSETLGDEVSGYLDDLREGVIVRLVGQVVPGKGEISTYISCYTVMKVTDMSEYAYYHSIELAFVISMLQQDEMEEELGNKEETTVYLSPYSISGKSGDVNNKSERNDFNLELIKDIEVPDDITDNVHKMVYRTLSYEIGNLKSEKRSFGINKDHIIKILKPYHEPSTVLSAISDLESKHAVIYESMDNHYCIL